MRSGACTQFGEMEERHQSSTAAKESPLRRKAQPMPTFAISKPAMAGPIDDHQRVCKISSMPKACGGQRGSIRTWSGLRHLEVRCGLPTIQELTNSQTGVADLLSK
jgi:hypothetical protein